MANQVTGKTDQPGSNNFARGAPIDFAVAVVCRCHFARGLRPPDPYPSILRVLSVAGAVGFGCLGSGGLGCGCRRLRVPRLRMPSIAFASDVGASVVGAAIAGSSVACACNQVIGSLA